MGHILIDAVCLHFREGEPAGMKGHLDRSGVGDFQVHMNRDVLMFARDQHFRELLHLLVMMELVSTYPVTVSLAVRLVYLGSVVVGQVLIEVVCLRFWEDRMGAHLEGLWLGEVQARMMFARNQYLWNLLLITGSPVGWLEFPFGSLSQPLRRSVVKSFRLVGERQTSQPPDEDKRGQKKHQDIPIFQGPSGPIEEWS